MLALALLFSLRLGALGLASCENDCDENSGPGLSLVQMSTLTCRCRPFGRVGTSGLGPRLFSTRPLRWIATHVISF